MHEILCTILLFARTPHAAHSRAFHYYYCYYLLINGCALWVWRIKPYSYISAVHTVCNWSNNKASNSKHLVAFHCGGKCEPPHINHFMQTEKWILNIHFPIEFEPAGTCSASVLGNRCCCRAHVVAKNAHRSNKAMHIYLMWSVSLDCATHICSFQMTWIVCVCSLSFLYVVISTIRHMGTFVRSIFDTWLVQPTIYIENKAMHLWNHLEMSRNTSQPHTYTANTRAHSTSECDEKEISKISKIIMDDTRHNLFAVASDDSFLSHQVAFECVGIISSVPRADCPQGALCMEQCDMFVANNLKY